MLTWMGILKVIRFSVPVLLLLVAIPGLGQRSSEGKLEACGSETAVFYHGARYALVGIGTQCWFKENLRTEKYRNGDAIPGVWRKKRWISTSTGAQTVNEHSPDGLLGYGRLYNWFAVADARGLCPSGFHVPSYDDWTELENAVGGSWVAGTALKSFESDSPPWDGANSSGFSALPGGSLFSGNGDFASLGYSGFWWSSTPSGVFACCRTLSTGSPSVSRDYYDVHYGFSVRCVRD